MFHKGQTFAILVSGKHGTRIEHVGRATRETNACVEVNGDLYKKDGGEKYGQSKNASPPGIIPIASADPVMLANYNARERFRNVKSQLGLAMSRDDLSSLPTETLAVASDHIDALLKALRR